MVAVLRGASRGDDFQVFAARRALKVRRQQQQRPGVGLRSLGQTGQRQFGHCSHVGGLGQLEGQPAELGRGAAHLRNAVLVFFAGRKELRMPAAMRDRRRLGGRQHAGFVVDNGFGRLRRRHAARRASVLAVARRRKRLGQLMDEDQLRMADADHVAGLQRPVAANHFAVRPSCRCGFPESRRIHCPPDRKHLGVVPAAALVLDHDLVGRCAADRDRLARHQTEHVAPFRPFANHQIRKLRHRTVSPTEHACDYRFPTLTRPQSCLRSQ